MSNPQNDVAPAGLTPGVLALRDEIASGRMPAI